MTDENATRVRRDRSRPAWRLALLALLALPASVGAVGCADHVQSSVVTCPCDHGVCCDSGVCATDENSCAQATTALASELAGHWTGYIEDLAYPSGSNALNVTLRVNADGSVSGQLALGAGPAPAPPIDGTVGWPSSVSATQDPTTGGQPEPGIEGYVYDVINLKWTALRLQFGIDITEAYGPWCRLQQPHYIAETDTWSCGASDTASYDAASGVCTVDDSSSGPTQVDCGWVRLCVFGYAYCFCNATGCDTPYYASGSAVAFIEMDIALRGNVGDGTMAFGVGQTRNVRLIRASD